MTKSKTKKSPEALKIQEQGIELERLRGALAIIIRENAGEVGEHGEELMFEYGGTGFENHPAVVSTRAKRVLRTEFEEAKKEMEVLRAKLDANDAQIAKLPPDPRVARLEAWMREAGRTSSVNHATLAEALKP